MSKIVYSKAKIDDTVEEEFALIKHGKMPMQINNLKQRIVVQQLSPRKFYIGPCYLPDSYNIGDKVKFDGGIATIKA